MRRLAYLISGFLAVCGVLGVMLYVVLLNQAADSEDVWAAAPVAGLGIAAAIGALLLVVALRTRSAGAQFYLPPLWLSAAVLTVLLVVGGFVARSERWPALDPVIAVLAMIVVFGAVMRIAARSLPSRKLPSPVVSGPTAWGMTAAPFIAIILQSAAVAAFVASIAFGVVLADDQLVERIRERGLEATVDGMSSDVIATPTVALALFAVYAIMAPVTEEFAKFLGVLIFAGRRAVARRDVYVAAVCAGLGFAVVETLAFALASAEQWPFIVALRAPVALIHVVGTVLVGLAWYAQQTGDTAGRWRLARGYGSAVLVHGAWNALTVAAIVVSVSIDDPDNVSVVAGLSILGIVGLMAVILVACLTWLLAIGRRVGHESTTTNETYTVTEPIRPESAAVQTAGYLHGLTASKV